MDKLTILMLCKYCKFKVLAHENNTLTEITHFPLVNILLEVSSVYSRLWLMSSCIHYRGDYKPLPSYFLAWFGVCLGVGLGVV